MRRRIFLAAAELIRRMLPMRGKVRIGHLVYRWANPRNQPFDVRATLFDDRLRFDLNMTSAHERMAFLMDTYEKHALDLLVRLYEGGTILDIGANIGLISVPLAARTQALAKRKPHLLAFEAIRSNFESLEHNIEVNQLGDAITAMPIALGAGRKQVGIAIEGDDLRRTGTANILPFERSAELSIIEVQAVDDLFADRVIPGDVSLIKIDTDGYDLEILRGSRTLLETLRPLCYAELNLHCLAWHSQTLDDVLAFVDEIGYGMLSQTGYENGVFAEYRAGMPFFDNALLVPRERLEEVKVLITR